jgi:hypothetical protein
MFPEPVQTISHFTVISYSPEVVSSLAGLILTLYSFLVPHACHVPPYHPSNIRWSLQNFEAPSPLLLPTSEQWLMNNDINITSFVLTCEFKVASVSKHHTVVT